MEKNQNKTQKIKPARYLAVEIKKRPPLYLGWVFGSLLKVLMSMVDLAFVNFIKKGNEQMLFVFRRQ